MIFDTTPSPTAVMAPRKKKTIAELKEAKRIQDKRRRERLRSDPETARLLKLKRHESYLKRKEIGKIKMILQMSEQDQRIQRNQWKKNTQAYRQRKNANQVNSNASNVNEESAADTPKVPVDSSTPPVICHPTSSGQNRIGKDRSAVKENEKLGQQSERLKKKIKPEINTEWPGKIVSPVIFENNGETIRKKLLFGVVVSEELRESTIKLKTHQAKRDAAKIILGNAASHFNKYGLVTKCANVIPLRMIMNMNKSGKSSIPRSGTVCQEETKQCMVECRDEEPLACIMEFESIKHLNSTLDTDNTDCEEVGGDEEDEEESFEAYNSNFIKVEPGLLDEDSISDYHSFKEERDPLDTDNLMDIDSTTSIKRETDFNYESSIDGVIKIKEEPDLSDDDINDDISQNYSNDSSGECSQSKEASVDVSTVVNKLTTIEKDKEIRNVDKSKEINNVDKSKEINNVDKSKEINNVENVKVINNVENSKEINNVENSKENNNVDISKEIKNDDVSKEVNRSSHTVARNLNEITRDDCQVFGDFVAGELRNLKNETNRKKLKRLIQKVIIEISELEEED